MNMHDFIQAKQTPDGGHILYGEKNYNSLADDILLIKTDSFGNITWAKTFGTPSGEFVWDVEILSKSYLVSAQSSSPATRFLMKVDTAGNILWTKTNICATHIVATADDGFVFTSPGTANLMYLTKLDSACNVLWRKKIDIANSASTSGLIRTLDNGFLISRGMYGFNGSLDFQLLRTDSMGNILWAKMYGGNGNEWFPAAELTFDGGFIAAGTTESYGAGSGDAILMKVDSIGTVQWTKTYGGIDYDGGAFVKRTFGSVGYILTGTTPGFSVQDDSVVTGIIKAYLIKVDINGNFQWARRYGLGGTSDIAATVWQTTDGGYTFSGATSGYSTGYLDGWFIKTDNMGLSGCYDWPTIPIVNSPAILDSNLIFIETSDTLNTGTGNFLWDSVATLFITIECTTDPTGSGIFNTDKTTSFIVFPNPSNNLLTIDFANIKDASRFVIYNSLGQFIFSSSITSAQSEINVSAFSSGIYLLRVITSKNEVHTQRFIKE